MELKISPSSNPNKVIPDPIAAKALDEARTIWDFIRASRDRTGGSVALAIVGPPGCGKSTLLQHVAVTLAANRQRRYGLRAYTPILLNLREHAAAMTDEPDISLGSLAQQHFAGTNYAGLNPPLDWFERRLRRGKGLILLDGLDEVAQADRRMAVSRWVDRQLRSYPGCRFVVTSRPQGYQDAPLEKANVVEVQPFSAGQARRFIENWYLANEIVSAGNKEDEGVRQWARRGADDLLKRLADPRAAALNALTVNPLLLTMIAMVHRYRGAQPGSRAELYRAICEVLLGRWRQTKGVLDDTLSEDQKRLVLMPLAARMMELEVREISAADALAVIRPPLSLVGIDGEAAKGFLAGIQASSGLLLERENGLWSFAHLTFQEYLTAVYWLEVKSQPADWANLVENSWWHETLRLYAARGANDLAGRPSALPRSGRPRTAAGIIDPLIDSVIDRDPRELGYRSTVWTAGLLRRHLAESHQLAVSQRSVSYALSRLSIRWKRPRHQLALRAWYWRQARGGSSAAFSPGSAPSS